MKSYIVFDPATEKILRTGDCPDDMVYIQAGQGECAIEGTANDLLHKIDMFTVEVKDKTPEADLPTAMPAGRQGQAGRPQQDEEEILIAKKEREIIRRLAIEELKKEGKP